MADVKEGLIKTGGFGLTALGITDIIGDVSLGIDILKEPASDVAKALLSIGIPDQALRDLLQVIPDIAKAGDTKNPLSAIAILVALGAGIKMIGTGVPMMTK